MRKRMLGLVISVAVFVPVLIAADSASATTLCKVQETPCVGGKRWSSPTLVAKATNAQFTTGAMSAISCTESVISGQFSGQTGTPFVSTIKSLTFVGCVYNPGMVNCSATVEHLPYQGKLSYTAAWSGNFKLESGGNGEPLVKFVCSTTLVCEFDALPEFSMTGGSPGTIPVGGSSFNRNGKACPAEAIWSGAYSVSSPSPFYVAE